MPNQRLISAIQGHKKGTPSWWCQLFRAVVKATMPDKRKDQPRQRRSSGSNAEYHLTIQELKRVAQSGKTLRDRVLMQMLAETGMRRSEVAALEIDDVGFDRRVVTVRQGKGNKIRLVPITSNLANNIRSLIADGYIGPVFASRNSGYLSPRQLNRIVAAAGTRAGVQNPNPRQEHITCHLFRHSFARLWKDQGGSIETLSRILGHRSQKTTLDLYGTQSVHDVRRNYEKIMRKLSGSGQTRHDSQQSLSNSSGET
jgi:integrase